MGKHYESELDALSSTVGWASKLDISHWTSAVIGGRGRDLVVVASGGSIAAAQLLAQLHVFHTGHLAVVMTPLEFISDSRPIDATVWLLSASGSNNDILQAWHATATRQMQEVHILCATPASPLVKLAESAGMPSMTFDPPTGRDGFLATNSLVAFLTIILRLYGTTPSALVGRPKFPVPDLTRRTLVVLHGGWLKAVAVDMESRFTEAALGPVQISDYRNFAHGRHHWLAKHGDDTAVLALISPAFAELARDTLAALPTSISVACWEFEEESPAIALAGIQMAMKVAGVAAVRMGYDAGRPGVPEFGHHLYDLKTQPRIPVLTTRELAVARKIQADGSETQQIHEAMIQGLTRFESALHSARFAGVVMDYDGTLVAAHRRFEDIDAYVAAQLNRLLRAGQLIGIATGRGKSVHEKLRTAIEQVHWPQCIIGYYNGSVIKSLADPCDELCTLNKDPMIAVVSDTLRTAPELAGVELDIRPQQITLSQRQASRYGLWMKVRSVVDRHASNSLKVVYSSHSVDVVPYLAMVMDVYSRKIIGWAMDTNMRTELILEALQMAVTQRQPRGVIHHSDRGSQYTSYAFGKRCQEAGIMPSMGSVGDAYDNAMAESFFASLEREVLNRRRFKSQAEAKMAVFEWIEGWYNPHRRHSGLGYRSPVNYERAHHQARARKAELLPPAVADSLSGKISKATEDKITGLRH